jgi:hypothetical protein
MLHPPSSPYFLPLYLPLSAHTLPLFLPFTWKPPCWCTPSCCLFSFVSSYHIFLLPYRGLFLCLTLSRYACFSVLSSLHISFSDCRSYRKNFSVLLHAARQQTESHSVSWFSQINLIWTAKYSFAEKAKPEEFVCRNLQLPGSQLLL